MSYCRWSSDDYQCDVYVYEDVNGGWSTHVAARRYLLADELPEPAPLPHPFSDDEFQTWWDRQQAVSSIVGAADMADIGLPFDGQNFNDPTAGECADRLEELRRVGYTVPQYAIDSLREDDRAGVA